VLNDRTLDGFVLSAVIVLGVGLLAAGFHLKESGSSGTYVRAGRLSKSPATDVRSTTATTSGLIDAPPLAPTSVLSQARRSVGASPLRFEPAPGRTAAEPGGTAATLSPDGTTTMPTAEATTTTTLPAETTTTMPPDTTTTTMPPVTTTTEPDEQ
jgi:hypothetical protein